MCGPGTGDVRDGTLECARLATLVNQRQRPAREWKLCVRCGISVWSSFKDLTQIEYQILSPKLYLLPEQPTQLTYVLKGYRC